MLPFRLGSSLVVLAVIGVAVAGLFFMIDELRSTAEAEGAAKNEAIHVAAEAKAAEDARKQADAAVDARLPAALPGSVARLRASWCRDCGAGQ